MIAVDPIKSLEETLNYQKKFFEGIKNMLSIEEVNVEAAPKELVMRR